MIELTTINLTLRWQMNNNDTLKRLNAMLKDINGENRPVKFTQGDTIITMSYDYMGRRFAKTVNGNTQLFVYDNYLQIAELNENSQIVKSYIWDPTEGYASRPLAMTIGNDFYYYTHDANKNITELVTSTGAIVAHYEYSPFGAVTLSTGSLANTNPFQFASEYHDSDLGLMYYNYRHYNPMDGKWLSRDPIEERGGYNLYGMIGNDLMNLTDHLGLSLVSPCLRCNPTAPDNPHVGMYPRCTCNDDVICNISVNEKFPNGTKGSVVHAQFELSVNETACTVEIIVNIYMHNVRKTQKLQKTIEAWTKKIKEKWENKAKLCCDEIKNCPCGLSLIFTWGVHKFKNVRIESIS